MRNLTATLCLTVAVLFGSAGVNYASSSPVRYLDLSELTYVNHDGKTINITIDASDPNNMQLNRSWGSGRSKRTGDIRLVGHFAVDGGNPYSPGHGNVSANIVGGSNRLANLIRISDCYQ